MIATDSRKKSIFGLFASRKFLPLFITQSLETFNDNLLKTAIVIMITYDVSNSLEHGIFLVAMTSVLIMLPYVFSPIAGQIADKYEKSGLICFIKFVEFLAMFLAGVGFVLHSIPILMFSLLIMGAHSAFFSPLKYSILPQHIEEDALVNANAWLESGIFVAIVLGTLMGGLLIRWPYGDYWVSYLGLAMALIGMISSIFVPHAKALDPNLRINLNIFTETYISLRNAKRNEDVWIALLGISWFWLIAVCFFNLLPAYSKHVLFADSDTVAFLLCVLAIGISIGAVIVQSLLKGEASFRYVPMGLLGIGISVFLMSLNHVAAPASGNLYGLKMFLSHASNWKVVIELLICAIFSGIFVVPQHAIMQLASDHKQRSRIIAVTNSVSAFFTVFISILIELLNRMHVTINTMLFVMAISNLFLFILTARLLPEPFLKTIIKWTLKSIYRVEIKGVENYHAIKDKAIIISNHVSYLDGMLLCAFLPDKISFAINTYVASRWWISPFITASHSFRLDSSNPMSIKTLIRELDARKRCIIFPEGRITATGRLMKIYEGPALVADKSHAEILPIRLDGVEFSFFASLKNVFKRKMFPKITMTIMPPKRLQCDPVLKGNERRECLGLMLYDLMSELMFDSSDYKQNLTGSLLMAAKTYDRHKVILEDSNKQQLTYSNLIKRIFTIAQSLPEPKNAQSGALVILEPGADFLATLYALQARGYLPVLVHDANDIDALVKAQHTSKATIALVSSVNRFYQQYCSSKLNTETVDIVNIDLHNLPSFQRARQYLQRYQEAVNPKDPALAIFNRTLTGEIQGIIVTHENIQASRFQLMVCLDLNPNDSVFNTYRQMHLFSIISGIYMPLLSGIKTILQPAYNNLHFIPTLISSNTPTILMADNAHLDVFSKEAYPYEFVSLRYVFADGATLSEATKTNWREKFGIRILSGLFSEDLSPVFALNTAMQHKPNTVGRILPKIDYKVEPINDSSSGGRLFVSGPNVTRFWHSDEDVETKIWYDTGKLVKVDEQGFMVILGETA